MLPSMTNQFFLIVHKISPWAAFTGEITPTQKKKKNGKLAFAKLFVDFGWISKSGTVLYQIDLTKLTLVKIPTTTAVL